MAAETALRFDRRTARWRIGLVALATDHTIEADFARLSPGAELALYVSRVAFRNPTNAENLRAMQPQLASAAGLILPGESLDALAYGCTAASVLLGDAAVVEALQQRHPDVPCVTPAAAAVHALRALGARRISVLAPYSEAVSAPFGDYFAAAGFEVLNLHWLGLEDDRDIARVTADCIEEQALTACDAAADALFVSCTALRTLSVLERLEQRLRRPVVCSNQALAWRAMRLAGCAVPVAGYGALLRC